MAIVDIPAGAKTMLVKLNLDEEQKRKVLALKDLTGENTASKSVLYALENYSDMLESYEQLKGLYDSLLTEHALLKKLIRQRESTQKQIEELIKP